jgi:parallel beta-helix repeat protein
MSTLATNYTDGTTMHGGHAAAHNATNQVLNNLKINNVLDNGAAGDGTTHDAAAINTTIGLGSRILIPDTPAGYYIDNFLNIMSGQIIEGNGYGSLLSLANGTGLHLQNRTNTILRDFRVDGTNLGGNSVYGIYLDQCIDITLDHLWLLNIDGYACFINNNGTAEVGKVRIINCWLSSSGTGGSDCLGGGPNGATGTLSELIITGNYITQGLGITTTDGNAIDIVAQTKTVISNNVVQGNILMGGEKVPHYNVLVSNNSLRPSLNNTFVRIGVLTQSNAGQTVDSSTITIANNVMILGNIFVQGQSGTGNRTRKVIISDNNIGGTKVAAYSPGNNGIDLEYTADMEVRGNTVDGSGVGIYLNDVLGVDVSNNRFLNCTTPIQFGPQGATNLTGHNNVGINPDTTYPFPASISGATAFDRINGNNQIATQAGNITVTLPSTIFLGEEMILDITTGGYNQSWPTNLKLAGGSLAMTGRSILTIRWDGTNWIEKNRSLNVS